MKYETNNLGQEVKGETMKNDVDVLGILFADDADVADNDVKVVDRIEDYIHKYAGGYEASRGDYEGAILARDEFNAGCLS